MNFPVLGKNRSVSRRFPKAVPLLHSLSCCFWLFSPWYCSFSPQHWWMYSLLIDFLGGVCGGVSLGNSKQLKKVKWAFVNANLFSKKGCLWVLCRLEPCWEVRRLTSWNFPRARSCQASQTLRGLLATTGRSSKPSRDPRLRSLLLNSD